MIWRVARLRITTRVKNIILILILLAVQVHVIRAMIMTGEDSLKTCRTCDNVICRYIESDENWDVPNDCDKWRAGEKKSVTKTELIQSLHTILAYCDNHCTYMCPTTEDKCECIFWDSCYYSASMVCIKLSSALEKLEND